MLAEQVSRTGDGKYSGSENGDVIAHIGYCAKLILKTTALATNSVGIGDPRGYGRSYRERALTYVREMDRSLDTFILPNFVSATDSNHYRWPESDSYRALGPVIRPRRASRFRGTNRRC